MFLSHPIRPIYRLALATGLLVLLTLAACKPMNTQPQAYAEPFTAQSDLALLREPGVLPRNINLKAFEPHRADFACRHAEAVSPAITPQAQALHEQAMALTSYDLWPNERNYAEAVRLWQQAARLGNWKSALMLVQVGREGAGENSEKGQFAVPAQDSEVLMTQLEELMRQGVPDAFYEMAAHQYEGRGGNQMGVGRKWAMWELAADLGSARAQTQIGNALNAGQDFPERQKWGNEKVALQMFECAYAQGNGEAAYRLGQFLDLDAQAGLALNGDKDAQFARARQVLHDGVKFGSEDAATYLSVAFRGGDPLAYRQAVDVVRADRYQALADALYRNPDLRFPNLDRVLPLPPAKLPYWDSKPESLINAAKAVRVTPKAPVLPAHSATGRAHVPPGHALVLPPELARYHERPFLGFAGILAPLDVPQGLASAPVSGYYKAYFNPQTTAPSWNPQSRFESIQQSTPQFYAAGHYMWAKEINPREFREAQDHECLLWQFVGVARPVAVLQDWLASSGVVHAIAAAQNVTCASGGRCPQSGIWQAYAPVGHPLAKLFNDTLSGQAWRHQTFVQQGQNMPVLKQAGADADQLVWRLMLPCEGEFCERRA